MVRAVCCLPARPAHCNHASLNFNCFFLSFRILPAIADLYTPPPLLQGKTSDVPRKKLHGNARRPFIGSLHAMQKKILTAAF